MSKSDKPVKRDNIQQSVNSMPDGSINQDELGELVDQMIAGGWEEIENKDFTQLIPGDQIRYTIIDPKGKHVFRTGGILMLVDESTDWLIYKGHTTRNWSLQKVNVVNLYRLKKQKKDVDDNKNVSEKVDQPRKRTAKRRYNKKN